MVPIGCVECTYRRHRWVQMFYIYIFNLKYFPLLYYTCLLSTYSLLSVYLFMLYLKLSSRSRNPRTIEIFEKYRKNKYLPIKSTNCFGQRLPRMCTHHSSLLVTYLLNKYHLLYTNVLCHNWHASRLWDKHVP